MRASRYLLTALILMTGAIARPAHAESPEEWIALGTRVHGGFGAFIPLGIRLGLDAVARLHAKPRELAVVYHDSVASPCACFADGVAIATSASVGQRTLTIAAEPRAGGRDRGGGDPAARRRRGSEIYRPGRGARPARRDEQGPRSARPLRRGDARRRPVSGRAGSVAAPAAPLAPLRSVVPLRHIT